MFGMRAQVKYSDRYKFTLFPFPGFEPLGTALFGGVRWPRILIVAVHFVVGICEQR